MPFDWTQGPLAEGLRCYRNREFFEAHEHWEAVWVHSPEPEKKFLQALIQITVACHHWQRGNPLGTARLLEGALRKLEAFPAEYGGLNVERIRAAAAAWCEALKQEREVAELPFPPIG